MLSSDSVKTNISTIAEKYKAVGGDIEAFLLAKLAILEFSGWIESAMDNVFLNCAQKALLEDESKEFKEILKRNYGFSYEAHLKKLSIGLIGRFGFALLETTMGEDAASLKNLLNSTYKQRTENAHTYIDASHPETLKTIDAPGITLANLDKLSVLLTSFEAALKTQLHI